VAEKLKAFRHYLPTEVLFGLGCFDEAPKAIARFGTRVLVVTGRRAMKAAGFTDRLLAGLARQGAETLLSDRVRPDPDSATVNEVAEEARRFGAEVVVGLGGGSAIDSAKGIAVAMTHDGPVEDYFRGQERQPTAATAPVVAIPSTSGTGSHVDPIAVITRSATGDKSALTNRHIFPRLAVVDPSLPAKMPPELTAITGFDAFAHAMEAFLATVCPPVARVYAEKAIRTIYTNLPRAIARGGDVEARKAMAWADTLAGWALAEGGVVSAHVLGMSIGSLYGVPHGKAVAMVTAASLKRGAACAPACYAPLARAMGLSWGGLGERESAALAAESVRKWLDGIGLGDGLASCGIVEGDLDGIAAHTVANYGLRVEADPTRPTVGELAAVLRESL